jgi:sterol desaturase/sphingolipid hydroxylase (fatty acid hydroxylase superfamily)
MGPFAEKALMALLVPYGYAIILFLSGITVLEFIWDRKVRGLDRKLDELLTNLLIFIVGNEIQVRICNVIQGYLLTHVKTGHLFQVPDSRLSFVFAFIVVDFFHYCLHRLEHLPPFWIAHSVHHSGSEFNFGTAARTPWFHLPLLMMTTIPTVALGFSPEAATVALAYNLTFQFFQHASKWPEIPYLDLVIVTSRYHSRHHAQNPVYKDCNFSAIFPWWDRIFGTFRAETEPVTFKNADAISGFHPILVNLRPILRTIIGAKV